MGKRSSASLRWIESEGRWRKKYMGRVFYFGAGKGNKIKSESAAKAAFKDWKLKVDQELQQERQAPASYDERLHEYWHNQLGALQDEITQKQNTEVGRDVWRALEILKRITPAPQTGIVQYDADPALEAVERLISESRPIEKPKGRRPRGVAPWENDKGESPDTIGTLVDAFLVDQRQGAGTETGISAARYDKLRVVMTKFLDFVHADSPITELDNALLNGWRSEVTRQVNDSSKEGIAPVTGRDMLAITKRLCNWSYNRGYIATLPRCLTARGQDAYTITVKAGEIQTAEISDIAAMLAIASPKARLVILLGLNCGYGPRDISGILKKEIDWKAGTITRARTKTSKRDKPTIVCFKLWPETIEAIKANLSTHAELAFTTDTGNPLVNETIGEDGIVKRHDAVHSIWFRLTKHAKVKTQLKQLRKLGATKIKEQYPQFVDHYLSHAAGKVSDIHYAATHQAGFHDALAWLRKQVLPSSMTGSKPAKKR